MEESLLRLYLNEFILICMPITMKLFIVVILIAVSKANVGQTRSNCVTIRNINYEKEVLKTKVIRPYQLVIDHDTNTLFFSYEDPILINRLDIAYLSLKTKDYGLVSGIVEGFANAVDSRSMKIYMGATDGIYLFNYDDHKAIKVYSGLNIWQMFYKNGLYFTTYPELKPFLFKDALVVEVSELKAQVKMLAVKNDGTFLYTNSSGLFSYNATVGHASKLADYKVNGFSSDIDGNIYFSTRKGIYYVNDKRDEIEELFNDDYIYGVAIEGNGNIIYSTRDSVVRLNAANTCV